MPQRNMILLLVAVVVSYACYLRADQNPFARYVANGFTAIDQWALEDIPHEELFAGAMNGMVDVLHDHGDEHSQFISAEDAIQFRAEMRQQIGGIGVRIRMEGDPPQLTIAGPPEPGTPAFRADIRAGDRILAIDDVPTAGRDMNGLLKLMRGEQGEPIRLSLLHPGEDEPVTIALVRSIIPLHSILGDQRLDDGTWQFTLDEDPRIATIRITAFGDKTAGELKDALEQLTEQGVEAVVLDLRDNAGGALDVAVAVCDMFLPAGKCIVETRGRGIDDPQRELTTGSGAWQQLPIAILINRNSASASEIMAAALQDHGRALVVGERSYGKGTVQQILSVGVRGRSLLKLTLASFWRPSGRNIHRRPDHTDQDDWGVRPDAGFQVDLSDEQYLAYRRYRSDRDLGRPTGESGDQNAADVPGGDSDGSEEFADDALRRAVGHLQGLLSEVRPAA